MTTKKHAVRVMIGGEEYTVRSDLPPEYTREVAAYVDQAVKKVLSQGPLVENHKAAILAALDITNELFQARHSEREVGARLAAVADDLAKMLPPAKRKAALS
ncbi:MAG: cell division protein ZapA [Myxococcota bacterium]